MNNRRWWAVTLAVLAAVGITAVGAALWGDDDGGVTTAPRMVPSTTTAPSTSTSTSLSTSTPSTSRHRPRLRGHRLRRRSRGDGARHGDRHQRAVRWRLRRDRSRLESSCNRDGLPGASSRTAKGPFSIAADFSVRTGKTTAGNDAVNLWSQEHIRPRQRFARCTRPVAEPRIRPGRTPQQYFRVVVYNAAGTAPPSASVCGVVPGRPAC